MRPKKRILLCCANEQLLSEMSFVLETRGFDVDPCVSVGEDFQPEYDCALLMAPNHSEAEVSLIRRIKQLSPGIPVVLWLKHPCVVTTPADMVIHVDLGMVTLLEAVKRAVARKRGPKKSILVRLFGEVAA